MTKPYRIERYLVYRETETGEVQWLLNAASDGVWSFSSISVPQYDDLFEEFYVEDGHDHVRYLRDLAIVRYRAIPEDDDQLRWMYDIPGDASLLKLPQPCENCGSIECGDIVTISEIGKLPKKITQPFPTCARCRAAQIKRIDIG